MNFYILLVVLFSVSLKDTTSATSLTKRSAIAGEGRQFFREASEGVADRSRRSPQYPQEEPEPEPEEKAYEGTEMKVAEEEEEPPAEEEAAVEKPVEMEDPVLEDDLARISDLDMGMADEDMAMDDIFDDMDMM